MITTATETTTGKRTLRVLHVGVSNRGTWPLTKCTEQTGFAPAALCDVSEDALAAACEKTGLTRSACYTDFGRALDQSEVDCVIICAPTVLHVPLATKAIEAGLPVLIEKGMAADWESARQLGRIVRQHDAIACVAQNYRYRSGEQTIARALRDPEHPAHPGPIHMIQYAQNRVRPEPRTLTYPFASVWDMSCHHLDSMLFWLGPLAAVTGFSWAASWSAYPHDNNTAAHLVFANGARGHYLHTHDAARANTEIQLHGERGALVCADKEITFNERPLENFGSRSIQEVMPEPGEGEADVLHDFHAYITEGREPGISVRHNVETMAACEMMVRSIIDSRTCGREELGRPMKDDDDA